MLYPMVMMVVLTFIVGLITARTRFASVRSGDVKLRYFKLMQGQDVPERVTVTSRSFNNMFEVPVLFYVACTLYISLGVAGPAGPVLAWSFVVLRYVHAAIHLTYNGFLHRMVFFWASFVCVLLLWMNLALQ